MTKTKILNCEILLEPPPSHILSQLQHSIGYGVILKYKKSERRERSRKGGKGRKGGKVQREG